MLLSVAEATDGISTPLLTIDPIYTKKNRPGSGVQPAGAASPYGLSPAAIRHAYGIDSINFLNGTIGGDGSGQTIAIVDAYDDTSFVNSSDSGYATSDLAEFSSQYGLPQFNSTSLIFKKINQSGGSTLPSPSTKSSTKVTWAGEIALDVEWAHSIAPEANITLVECDSNSNSDLYTGASTAASTGASVVSMSFGSTSEGGGSFTHTGVTFVASTGDSGTLEYPSSSPNVLAVGGTHLNLNGDNSYSSETGWSSSGGGISSVYGRPTYQNNITDVTNTSNDRMVPDISFDADTSSAVSVYDSYDQGSSTPWVSFGGTSVSAPCWAGLIAIADEGRQVSGLSGTLTTSNVSNSLDVQRILYTLPSTDFHDISTPVVSNHNGSTQTGYDLVTGIGTPIANLLIPDLAGLPQAAPSGLSLATASDSGVSNSDRITNITTPTITGTAAANSTIKLYENSTLIGQGTATSSGTFSIATTVLANGTHIITATDTTTGGTSAVSGGVSVTIDTVAPTIGTLSFNPNLTSMTITIPFSENVSSSLSNASLSVSGVAASSQAESFNTGTNTASFTFTPGYAHGLLPDGNYTASVVLANVTDIAGNHPTSTTPLNFFVLDGDANFDRFVNALDFNALATNYGKPNPHYGDGDFNYDGTINSSDFAILAAKFGKQLAAADLPDDGDSISAQPASATVTQSTVFSDQPISSNLADDVLT